MKPNKGTIKKEGEDTKRTLEYNPIVREKNNVKGVVVSRGCLEHQHKCATCNERWRIIKRWGTPDKLLDFIARYAEIHHNETRSSLIKEISYISGYPEKAIKYIFDKEGVKS